MPFPETTALERTCVLQTPSELINRAFRYAKNNIARCMRWYTLGWGMSNAPHVYTLVVGRDTGWMSMGADYVASWFAPAALQVFRDRQKPNGQILEYIDMESGKQEDYGLNIGDNTPLYIWAVWHHWQQYADEAFRSQFVGSVQAAADHLLRAIGPNGLLVSVPAGTGVNGITSWRNLLPDTLAGEVTEINSLSSMALMKAAELTGDDTYARAAAALKEAINRRLWTGGSYLLNIENGVPNPQASGDMLFPLMCGIASPEQRRLVLERLGRDDFWMSRGMRTLPNTDPAYHPTRGAGLMGGSWPNLSLWYSAMTAKSDPERAVRILEMVARPVAEEQDTEANVHPAEFPEWFHGDSGVNQGMHLSPWTPPTFIWAVLEGLLGLSWDKGRPVFNPHLPADWKHISVQNMPSGSGPINWEMKP